MFAEIKVPHFTQEMEHEVEVGDTIQLGESMVTVAAFGDETNDTVDNETIIPKARAKVQRMQKIKRKGLCGFSFFGFLPDSGIKWISRKGLKRWVCFGKS